MITAGALCPVGLTQDFSGLGLPRDTLSVGSIWPTVNSALAIVRKVLAEADAPSQRAHRINDARWSIRGRGGTNGKWETGLHLTRRSMCSFQGASLGVGCGAEIWVRSQQRSAAI